MRIPGGEVEALIVPRATAGASPAGLAFWCRMDKDKFSIRFAAVENDHSS
jgi:hypothetical protein